MEWGSLLSTFAHIMCHGICQLKFYEGANQRIEDRIMTKPCDQIITLIESSIESPKPECRKLKPKDRSSETKNSVKLGIRLAVDVHWLCEILFAFCGIQVCAFWNSILHQNNQVCVSKEWSLHRKNQVVANGGTIVHTYRFV